MFAHVNNDEIKVVPKLNHGGLFIKKTINFSGPGIAVFITIFISVVFGFWFRIKGLGKFPLAVDEYFIVKSAQNILKYGLPQFEGGGYYVRGLIQQYITAALMLAGMKAEFASRLFPLIANLLVIPPLYKLGKKLSGQFFAAILVAVFCLSSWEVEMARFARMYAPFQVLFIWYLLYLYEYIVEDKLYRKTWVYVLSAVSIFVIEAGFLLLVLNILILLFKRKISLNDIIVNVILIILGYSYLSFDFMSFNTHHLLPEGIPVTNSGTNFILLPKFMLSYIPQGIFSSLLFIIISLLTVISTYYIHTKYKAPFFIKVSYSLLLLLSLFHLFGVILLFILSLLALNWINISQFKERPVRLVSITIMINFLFWFVFIIIKFWERENTNSFLRLFKETAKVLIKYPNYDILTIYLHAIPAFTITSGILLGILFFRTILKEKPENTGKRFLFFTIVFLILSITFINVNYNETRYTFFLFPVILLLILDAVKDITKSLLKNNPAYKYIFAIPVILFLFISEDFNLHHLINIDSNEINYRLGMKENLAYHYYLRWDAKTPAEIINKNLQKDDIVIINSPVSEFYLKRLDYVYNDYRSINFINCSISGGTKERWSSAKLIYRNSDLLSIINNRTHTIWLIADNNKFLREADFYKKYNNNLFYKTIDGRLNLYKFQALLQPVSSRAALTE